jgi:diguanylate cyclase (GGDEF)-like protein
MSRAEREMRAEFERLKQVALVDTLTRVWNRGAILDVLAREVEFARREGRSMGVLMADLDRFKEINDTRGHPGGDAVLLEAARRIRAAMRPYDSVGRIGGEEFLIVLPGAEEDPAMKVGERIRAEVAASPVELTNGSISLTISLGVATWKPGTPVDPLVLVAAADAALYRAKAAGRNRVMA